MFQLRKAALLTVAGYSPIMAETPARMMMGVERVAITCTADASLNADEARAICADLVKKAKRVTSLPVAVATANDLKPANLALASNQLLLSVALSAAPATSGPRILSINVTSGRTARELGRNAPIKSQAQLAKIGGTLAVQGPVDAFTALLGSGPKRLHRPIRSDS